MLIHQIRPLKKGFTFCNLRVSRKLDTTTIHCGASCRQCRKAAEKFRTKFMKGQVTLKQLRRAGEIA